MHSRSLGKSILLSRFSVAVLALVLLPQLARAQWQASVGAQSKDLGRQALAFLPNELWIHAGDSVTWTAVTDEPHTITFLANGQVRPPFAVGCPGFSPSGSTFDGSTCVDTPPLGPGQSFTVEFPTAGNYKLACLFHEQMTGSVHVLDPSLPLPHDQEFYDKQAREQGVALLAQAVPGSHHEHGAHDHLSVTVGGGTVTATGAGKQTFSLMRFTGDTIVIHAGDTVTWTNTDSITPHTVTFGVEPANPIPPAGNITTDPDGALHAVLNSTSDSAHSGFLVADAQDRIGLPQVPLGITRFRITFTRPGVYPYICALHDGLGMKGKVIVLH
ncbi:MAG: plastocyanin/azurin family copper-binding protein [Terriglobales bacterium]